MREKLSLSCDHFGLAGLTPPPPSPTQLCAGQNFSQQASNESSLEPLAQYHLTSQEHMHNITSPHSRYTRLILVVALAMANQKLNALWT